MNTTIKPQAAPALAPRLLNALKRLARERVPHACGGFTTDDMEWCLGTAFTGEEKLRAALEECPAELIRRERRADRLPRRTALRSNVPPLVARKVCWTC